MLHETLVLLIYYKNIIFLQIHPLFGIFDTHQKNLGNTY